jgi:hypothetical protein
MTLASQGRANRWTFLYKSPVLKNKRGKPKQCKIGFGSAIKITAEEAQAKAAEARAMLAKGIDPLAVKGGPAAPDVQTLRQVADAFLPLYAARRNLKPSVRGIWNDFLEPYPDIMAKPVKEVTETDILGLLEGRPDETKRRIFWMFRRVLKWLLAQGHISVNPIAYMLEDKIPLAPVDKDRHMPSMPWRDVPAFWEELQRNESLAGLCLQWIILAACRPHQEGAKARFEQAVKEAVDFPKAKGLAPSHRLAPRIMVASQASGIVWTR